MPKANFLTKAAPEFASRDCSWLLGPGECLDSSRTGGADVNGGGSGCWAVNTGAAAMRASMFGGEARLEDEEVVVVMPRLSRTEK
jgi:hypothetical protein